MITRLSSDEIKNLAKDIITNKTYIAIDEEHIKDSFSVVILLMSKMTDEEIHSVGALYEDWHKAGPRGINGLPFFLSCKFLHIDDLPLLYDKLEEYQKALNA